MVTRQEQFELDRQKMLASIGQEPDEPKINIEEPKETQSPASKDFEEQLESIKEGCESAEEYENRAVKAFEEHHEFENSIRDLPEEKQTRARKLRSNKRKRVKARRENHPHLICGFGVVTELLDDFQATFGGGILFKFYCIFVAFPVVAFYYLEKNWLQALIMVVFTVGVGRFAGMWLSFIAKGLVAVSTAMGPKYICDVREGTPALKLIVSLLNKGLWFATNTYIFVFVGVFVGIAINMQWASYNWLDAYLTSFGFAFFFAIFAWVGQSLFGFGVYSAMISVLMSGSHPTKYRLRYLCDSGRVMIPTRKVDGSFVSKQERLRAFARDYTGIA